MRTGCDVRPSVDFDDESFVAPEKVDLVSGNPNIDLGLGKAMATAEGEYAVLELRSRAVGFVLITDRQAHELGLADGGGELGWGKEGMEVGERARGIGHRDAVTAGAMTGTERGGTVQDDAAPLSFPAVLGTLTSTGPSPASPASDSRRTWRRMPQSSAALVWLSTAFSPQASTPAIHRPFSLSVGWPTA